MTDLPDWAKDRAREWYRKIWPGAPKDQVDLDVPIIAAALVVERERTLAEVRRVVEGVKAEGYYSSTCNEILSRLEKLK